LGFLHLLKNSISPLASAAAAALVLLLCGVPGLGKGERLAAQTLLNEAVGAAHEPPLMFAQMTRGRLVGRPYETQHRIMTEPDEGDPYTSSLRPAQSNGKDDDKDEAAPKDNGSKKDKDKKNEKDEKDEKDEEEYALEREVLVTATRTETDASNVSAFVTVVRPADLVLKPKTAAEMLQAIPGLKFDRYGGGISLTSPSIRGSFANQVLVMIDGVRLNSARGDGVDLSDIPAQIIDRIEIVRGGSSALYGSDAMGGVINVITKRATGKPVTKLSLTCGSFGTLHGAVSRYEGFKEFDYSLSFFYGEADGDFPYKFRGSQTKRIENGGYSTKGLFFRTSYRLNPKTQIGLTHIFNDVGKRLSGRIEFPTPDAEQKNRWNLTTFSLKSDSLVWDGLISSLTINHRTDHLFYYDPVFVGKDASGYSGHRFGAEVLLSYAAGTRQFFTLSASVGDEKQNSVNSGTHTRTTSSVFLQDLISLLDDRVILIPAARFDRCSGAGDSFNPKIGIRFKVAPFLSLKANASRSFRVPGFDDLYWPRSGFAVGNPDLSPEKCRSYDGGVELKIEKLLELEVACFLNRAKNLIQWQQGTGSVWSPTNVGEAEMKGVEAQLATSFFRFCHLEVLHTYTDAKDMTDPSHPTQLIRRPRNRTIATLRVGPEWLSGSAQVTRTSESYTTVANTKWLPAYTVVDCGLRAMPLKGLALSFSAQNVFNRSYEVVPGYAMPGRSYSLTIETRFEGR